ncbi:MAG: hypothetical protein M1402_01105 [Candidatus Thermoplasmatota archaeon]|nr:hypothetical protein [Candidatus Thermoplasmatota archaeon]
MDPSESERVQRLHAICARVVKLSSVRSFPDGYLKKPLENKITLPLGSNITMFRQDEFIVVTINSDRIYLRSNNEAKYILYCAKRGQRTVPSPQDLDLEKIIGQFERDLDITLDIIRKECEGFSESDSDYVKTYCSELLGYHDIF